MSRCQHTHWGSPLYTVITKSADPSLVSQVWIIGKPCFVIVDTGAHMSHQARHCHRVAQKDIRTNVRHCRQYLGKPYLERRYPDTSPGLAPSENLCVCGKNYKVVHLGDGHPAHIRCICGPRAPNAASCRGRGIAMEPQSGASAFQPCSRQRLDDACTVQESGDGSIGEPPQSGRWPGRTESGGPRTWRILHIQDPGTRLPGRICEGRGCYPSH
jgi:hypothetical protein